MSFHKPKSAHVHQVLRALLRRGAAHNSGFDVVEAFADVAQIPDPEAFRQRMEAVRRIEMSGRGLRAKHLPMRQGQRTPLGLLRVREVSAPVVPEEALPGPDVAVAAAAGLAQVHPAGSAAPVPVLDLAATTHAAVAAMPELAALVAPQAWLPSDRQLASGQRVQQAILAQPEQLTVKEFAKQVGKSVTAVYAAIAQRRLLSLRLNERTQRIPSWQADLQVRRMVGRALREHPELDTWTAHQAFTAPVGVLGGLSLVQACQQGLHTPDRLLAIFRAELGLQPSPIAASPHQGA
jgi:hypothetical protein